MKSGSLLTKNPFCLYPGELHGSPTTALGDDELSRHPMLKRETFFYLISTISQ